MKPSCKIIFLLVSLGMFINLNAQEKTEITFHKSHYVKKQSAPFSDVVQAGNTFYLAGQIGMNHTSRIMVKGGIKAETEQVIKNIEEVLKLHNMDLGNVVKCTVILSTMDDFAAFNEVYSKHLTNKPARTTFAAAGLARNAKIEIDVIAVK